MEENCLKVFNCTESISGCSDWFHDFWLARVNCSLWMMRGICNCMPGICWITVGLDANAGSQNYSNANNATNDEKTNKKQRSKNVDADADADIEEIQSNEENEIYENNHEIIIINEEDEVLK